MTTKARSKKAGRELCRQLKTPLIRREQYNLNQTSGNLTLHLLGFVSGILILGALLPGI